MYANIKVAVESYPFISVAFFLNFKITGVKEEDISQTIVSPPVLKKIKVAAARLLGVYAEDIQDSFLLIKVISKGESYESDQDSWIDATQSPVFVKVKKFARMKNTFPFRMVYTFQEIEAGPFADRKKCVVEFPSFAELFRFNSSKPCSPTITNKLQSHVLEAVLEHFGLRRACFIRDYYYRTDLPADICFNVKTVSYD